MGKSAHFAASWGNLPAKPFQVFCGREPRCCQIGARFPIPVYPTAIHIGSFPSCKKRILHLTGEAAFFRHLRTCKHNSNSHRQPFLFADWNSVSHRPSGAVERPFPHSGIPLCKNENPYQQGNPKGAIQKPQAGNKALRRLFCPEGEMKNFIASLWRGPARGNGRPFG